jgi:hypothetical protein
MSLLEQQQIEVLKRACAEIANGLQVILDEHDKGVSLVQSGAQRRLIDLVIIAKLGANLTTG